MSTSKSSNVSCMSEIDFERMLESSRQVIITRNNNSTYQIEFVGQVVINGDKIDAKIVIDNAKLDKENRKHGHWVLLNKCSNTGAYCSICHKKIYKMNYANQSYISKFCPNCGAVMDEKLKIF